MMRDLTSQEAEQKLQEHGYNELIGSGPKNSWRIVLYEQAIGVKREHTLLHIEFATIWSLERHQ